MALSTGTRVRRRATLRLAALVVVVLALGELVEHYGSAVPSHVAVPVAAVGVTVLARNRGFTWSELGLARSTWRRGATYGLLAALAVCVVVAIVAALPLTRDAFVDDRYDDSFGNALVVALVYLPLRTVIPEELAFRGVLLAIFRRTYSTRTAVIASSVLFGLWHVSSSLGLAGSNKAVAGPLGSGLAGQAFGVIGSVLVTTVAGVVFCWLRLRSESLLAPIGLHWAINGAGILAVSAVWNLTN